MKIKEFYTENELNNKKIYCNDCKRDNFQKDLYFCQCNKNIGGKSKRNNHKNHSQILHSEKSYYCTEHQKKYMTIVRIVRKIYVMII